MAIVNILNEVEYAEYEEFVSNHPNGSFLQSLKWAKVRDDQESRAVVVRENNKIVASALILIKNVKLFNTCLLYLPRGPVWDYNKPELFDKIMEEVELVANDLKAYHCIIDPLVEESDQKTIDYIVNSGFSFKANQEVRATMQLRDHYVLRFNGRNKDEMMASFHSKWRYNIRLAKKKGVVCKVCGKEALDDFCSIMNDTEKRQGFMGNKGKDHFAKMMDGLGESCRLYMCYSAEGVPISGAVTVQYAKTTNYVYGASSNQWRNLMPNHLMQWEMICWSLDNNDEVYDFYGIPHYQDENHNDYGIYRFKKGFNGEVVTYAGEFKKDLRKVTAGTIKLAGKIKSIVS